VENEHPKGRSRREDDHRTEREAAGQVAGDDEGQGFDYFRGMPYFETQSFTVAQSRFSKKASM
jgi:hypothetical protein